MSPRSDRPPFFPTFVKAPHSAWRGLGDFLLASKHRGNFPVRGMLSVGHANFEE
jgi:hypothetical protein